MGSQSVRTLIFCVIGLYALFLTWSLLQERINTKPYGYDGETPIFFKAPLVVNAIQALLASLVGFAYSFVAHGQNPFRVLITSDGLNINYLKSFIVIAISSSVSSPLGYESLKHVDYVAYLLAKSCKLLPVMLVHFVLYRTRFPLYKYVVAGLVTGGVVLFTLAKAGGKSRTSINDGNVALGMSQLLGLMLLDGFTNSTQDQMFRDKTGSQKLTGASLMFLLNAFVFVITLGYLLVFKFESEAAYTIAFIQSYPRVIMDLVSFALLGAVGQVFVFIILEKFGSLILVTATVTRKMLSMILSVVLFGHVLTLTQWIGVTMVFGGIGYEAYFKMALKTKPKKD